mmetsp:Transcript_12956/g.21200  ORF Transcript_12956/g.21200 Transcript_12956/m.21200 type:complete len:89 (+) Transcript_12956:4222-4488(+)
MLAPPNYLLLILSPSPQSPSPTHYLEIATLLTENDMQRRNRVEHNTLKLHVGVILQEVNSFLCNRHPFFLHTKKPLSHVLITPVHGHK